MSTGVPSAAAPSPPEAGPPAGRAPAWRWLNAPFLALILLYRAGLAPLLSGHCRFHPSCSRYAQDAYLRFNPVRASWLTLRRLLRCHPWGGGGYDPVE